MSHWVKPISDRTRGRLRRGFWILMSLAHAPALIKIVVYLVSGQAGELNAVGALALLLAYVLFALKIFDVKSVRFNTDRRSVCTLALAFALLHVNTLRYVHEDIPNQPQSFFLANVLMTTTLASVRRILRRVVRWAESLYVRPTLAGLSTRWAYQTTKLTPSQRSEAAPITPRAPPYCYHPVCC